MGCGVVIWNAGGKAAQSVFVDRKGDGQLCPHRGSWWCGHDCGGGHRNRPLCSVAMNAEGVCGQSIAFDAWHCPAL